MKTHINKKISQNRNAEETHKNQNTKTTVTHITKMMEASSVSRTEKYTD